MECPPERLVVDRLPAIGVEAWTVYDTRRHWAAYHENYAACLLPLDTVGHNTWRHRGREHEGHPGSVMLLQPGEAHRTTRAHNTGNFTLLQIGPEMARRAADEIDCGRLPDWQTEQIEAKRVGDVFETLTVLRHALMAGADPEELEAWCLAAVCKLFERCTERRSRRSPIPHAGARRAYELVMNRYREHWRKLTRLAAKERPDRGAAWLDLDFTTGLDLETLAKTAGLAPSHLSRTIHRCTGLTLRETRVITRVTAGRMLLEAGMSGSAVARMLLYANHPAFSREFKRFYGVVPSRWPRR